MDDVGTALLTTSDISQGKYEQTATRTTFFVTGKVSDHVIDKNISDKTLQTILKHRVDAYLDKGKDGIIEEQNKEQIIKLLLIWLMCYFLAASFYAGFT